MALQEEFEQQGNFLFRYRGQLPIVIFVIGAFVLYFTRSENLSFLNETHDKIYDFAALGISIIGLFVRAYTVGRAAPNTSGRNTSEGQVAETVNTSGIYSVVRHPLYVGNYLMWTGIALLTQNVWFVVAYTFVYWVYYERIMFAEEQFLRRKFGTQYTDWAAKTPAFIPCFKNAKKNVLPLNIKKAIRQEKTGLFLLTIVMYLMNLIAQFGETNDLDSINYFNEWAYIAGFGVFSYAFIKLLQKTTKILSD